MHEVYAAYSIIILQQQLGGRERLSEDEFYASYSEPPWRGWSRGIRALFDRSQRVRQRETIPNPGDSQACCLKEA
ncbi:hypothetical protein J2045_000768 [Peteryoungia aggregata LMG 23059]|uniref:Uncharacterized protein n=1 Tax=Peteryoungia aggregata LMG 23059 TaxID=1368425 RepID=A0ABU0G4Y1_9HYPH|nr:hypothetical protein [Peteryoungia aggregata]MDQ0419755.1 hypothetical protein [Peteryoungia aggregata LMG 23059]